MFKFCSNPTKKTPQKINSQALSINIYVPLRKTDTSFSMGWQYLFYKEEGLVQA